MTKKCILILFLLSTTIFYAQKTLSDYSYVVVPEQFEFVEGKDKYKLNSLTKYLFNKNGFNAYMTSEVPNLNRCNGLYANVEKEKAFLRTKVVVTLKDCDGNLLYTSREGTSKYKEYRKAYQDAIRNSFESIEALNIRQKDVEILASKETVEAGTETKAEKELEKKIVKQPSVTNTSSVENLPAAKFSNYKKDGKFYLLRKTDKGYSLYEESSKAENGLQLIGAISVADSKIIFKKTNGETYDAYFDKNKNLSLFIGDQVVLYTIAL